MMFLIRVLLFTRWARYTTAIVAFMCTVFSFVGALSVTTIHETTGMVRTLTEVVNSSTGAYKDDELTLATRLLIVSTAAATRPRSSRRSLRLASR
jgi:hypothetical protein